MAKKLLTPGSINEAKLRSAMAARRYDDPPPAENPPPPEPPPEPDAAPVAVPELPARKNTAITDFESRFMRMSEPTERKQVWIGAQIKEQLGEVVKQIGGNRVNLQSYIDLILLDHIATYREEINRIYHKQPKKKEVL